MYRTTYTYDSPGSAGPFKGATQTDRRYKRGESIRAPFGNATVKSSRSTERPAMSSVSTAGQRIADRIDGYDRDDIGESLDY